MAIYMPVGHFTIKGYIFISVVRWFVYKNKVLMCLSVSLVRDLEW